MKIKKPNEWVKCFKINCSPPIEVYETHINHFGSNIYIEDIDFMIASLEHKKTFLKEAKEIWEREFFIDK